jgi:hypothetical protein
LDFDGANRGADRGLHLADRQGHSEKGGGKIKVSIFHYVPQFAHWILSGVRFKARFWILGGEGMKRDSKSLAFEMVNPGFII